MTRRRYAAETTVPVPRTKGEIEALLEEHGADEFLSGRSEEQSAAFLAFRLGRIRYRMTLPLPKMEDYRRTRHRPPQRRDDESTRRHWEQACRSSWRALLLLLKAQLEAVSLGIVATSDVLLPWMVLPGGKTVAEQAAPVVTAIADGREVVPPLLPGVGGRSA